MSSVITCPRCSQEVDSKSRKCAYCGIDLAMAAAIAEQDVQFSAEIVAGRRVSPEVLVPRLGEYLVEKGVIQPAELERAVAHQAEEAESGETILLGESLRQLGIIDREMLDQAVAEQILLLHSALRRSNRELEARVKERTQELELALSKLTELNRLKANFIANISHELRTPLTHMRGYLDLLDEGDLGPLSEAQKEALAVLRRAENRLESLIEDLIQFAFASRGELPLDISAVDIGRLVQAAVDHAQSKAETKQVKVELYAPDELPLVLCDEEKIYWVMNQLLDNAIKFTPQGGGVKIEALNHNGSVTIIIVDTGIGIPADRLEEVFEPFHQLDGSATRRYGGTGMGLALSNRIIRAHGSQIEVDSIVDAGSRFRFSLSVTNGRLES
ncbi:MAG: HAMP domain-containing sensor histidine kinase [Anaerolineales bacterium]|jgi:signal transduction histidine kinase